MDFHLRQEWTFDDALPLIRAIQPEVWSLGFHTTLGGGVLNHGHSNKDLDLFFLPMESREPKPTGLVDFLVKTWGGYALIGQQYPDELYGFKAKFDYSGLRIDAFVLGPVALDKKIEDQPDDEDLDRDLERAIYQTETDTEQQTAFGAEARRFAEELLHQHYNRPAPRPRNTGTIGEITRTNTAPTWWRGVEQYVNLNRDQD